MSELTQREFRLCQKSENGLRDLLAHIALRENVVTETDLRRLKGPRSEVKTANKSRVYRTLSDAKKPMAIDDLSRAIPEMNEQTVRRAVKELTRDAFIKPSGKRPGGAQLYTVIAQGAYADDASEKCITYANDLLPVGDFLAIMAAPLETNNPFAVDSPPYAIRSTYIQRMRKLMAATVMTAGEAGMRTSIDEFEAELEKIHRELKWAASILEGFLTSPIWYDEFRDRVAYNLRRMQQENPELHQLTHDFILNQGD